MTADPELFFFSDTVTGRVARAIDWSDTPLGPASEWPTALKLTLALLFNTQHPVFLFWGPEHRCFYNDGYIPIVGAEKHPCAMGRPGAEVWAEAWHLLEPQIEQVMTTGRSTFNEDHLVPIRREGKVSEAYFTYSYSPVFTEAGAVVGTLVVCTETTDRVLTERAIRRNEEELRSQRRWLEDVMDRVKTGILIVEPGTGAIRFANRAATDMVGKFHQTAEECRASSRYVTDSEGRRLELDEYPRLRASRGERIVEELFVWHSPEKRRELLVSSDVIPATRDHPASVLVNFVDVTAQRVAEAQRAAGATRLKLITDATPALLAYFTPDARIEWVNASYERVFGMPVESLRGRYVRDLVGPEVFERSRPYLERAARGEGSRFENWMTDRSGATRYVELEYVVDRAADGRVAGVIVVGHDVTERRRTEEQFRALADSITHLAWMADAEGALHWFNHRWYEYTGTSPAEVRGRGWQEALHPEHRERVATALEAAWAGGEPWELTFPLRSAAGEWRWFLTRAVPVKEADGKVSRWFGTNTDIDREKRARDDLELAIRARDEFLSIASHELRTPVSSLKLQLQSLGRQIDRGNARVLEPANVKRVTEIAVRQVDRLTLLVEDMLDVSRIATGRLALEPVVGDVGRLVEETCAAFRNQFEAEGVELAFRTAPDLRASFDGFRFEQVVSNLLTNALKYGGGKPVEVEVDAADGGVELRVRDHGIGIAPEARERIFGRFERAISSRHISGLGLGLYITREIVRGHGGRVTVESELGRGSCFRVWLPAS